MKNIKITKLGLSFIGLISLLCLPEVSNNIGIKILNYSLILYVVFMFSSYIFEKLKPNKNEK